MNRIFNWNWIRKREAATAACTPGVPSSTDEKDTQVTAGSFEERISYVRSPETALTVSAVYRAITLRCETMGIMPVEYQKRIPADNNYVADMYGVGKRCNYLLNEEPNPLTTAPALWSAVWQKRLMEGNGFVYIERDEFGFPMNLWLVNSGSYNMVTGLYYLTYMSEHGYEEVRDVPRSDVMHFPNTFRQQNGFWGISTLHYAIDTLSLNKTLRRQSLETAAKGGRVKLLIGEEKPANAQGTIAFGMMNKQAMNDYAEELQKKMYSGHDILAIRGLSSVQNISMTASEMQATEQVGMTYDDVARFFAVPRPLLMLDTNSHYNDYQNATMEFHTRTILPDKTLMEKEIARKLIRKRDYGSHRIFVNPAPLMAMDPERQAKVDEINLRTGANSVNEIRATHNMPSAEKGDIIYVSTNVAELGSKKLSGDVPETKPAAQNDETK